MKNLDRILIILIISFLLSCGRKGDPVLETINPLPIKEISVVQRDNRLELTWKYPKTEIAKIKGFRIYKAEIKSHDKIEDIPNFKEITFLKGDSFNFKDEDIRVNQTYLYKIVVVNQKGRLSEDSPIITVKPLMPLKAPKGITYSLKKDSIEIRWEPSELVQYYIYKSYEKGNYITPLNNLPLKENFFEDRIDKKRTVYYAIKAIRDNGFRIESPLSEELEVNPDTFVPSKPEKPVPVISEKGVYLVWKENPETWINGYRIYKKGDAESEFKAIGDTLLPTFLDKEVIKSKSIYYITALGPLKESTPSDPLEVYPLLER